MTADCNVCFWLKADSFGAPKPSLRLNYPRRRSVRVFRWVRYIRNISLPGTSLVSNAGLWYFVCGNFVCKKWEGEMGKVHLLRKIQVLPFILIILISGCEKQSPEPSMSDQETMYYAYAKYSHNIKGGRVSPQWLPVENSF